MKSHNTTIIYGYHVVRAWLNSQPGKITRLILSTSRDDQRSQQLQTLAQQQGVAVEVIAKKNLSDLLSQSGLSCSTHQSILAEVTSSLVLTEQMLPNLLEDKPNPLVLVLDGIQDPQNLGACLRNANGFGVDAVIAPKDKAVSITPTVMKVASGALAETPFIAVTNLVRTLEQLKQQGLWIVGLSDQAEQTVGEVDYTGAIAVVLGREGQGLRRLTQKHCDYLVSIPMLGCVSSLNVGCASSVVLYEVQRQRCCPSV